ncbi:MAG: nucleotidyl transferase AbiEii/AbiGii toxin family protein [Steroidobacteraceae bacterium]
MGMPHLDVLPAAQRRLWDELGQVPRAFVLYGGTAIALQLGHRQSIDFDFFTPAPLDVEGLQREVPFLREAVTLRQAPGAWTVRVDRQGAVKVSMLHTPFMKQLESPAPLSAGGCRVAALLDLAAAKASVVQQRAEAKDYLDVDALILSGISLPKILAAASLVHGQRFDPQSTLKALCYFGDGDLPSVPSEVQMRLRAAVREVNLQNLPVLAITPVEIGA